MWETQKEKVAIFDASPGVQTGPADNMMFMKNKLI